jgi:hypothetical protein
MKNALAMVLAAVILAGCSDESSKTPVAGTPVVVGSKTDLYEVSAKDRLHLATGVTFEVTPGPNGQGSGLIIFKDNQPGGYMACGCTGAQTSNCKISSDNPENDPSCSGSCTDSEGNAHACEMENRPGPPRDPPQYWTRAPSSGTPGTSPPAHD